jgi:aspartyl-tRNA(Asn)/glutamyl-tRNA(Gln) amidotransferase subunit A
MSQWPPIAEIAAQVKAKKLSAVDMVKQALKTIAEKSEYQAIISTLPDQALARAKAIDSSTDGGRLAGVPFIAKDNFLVYGPDTTAASNILKGFKAPYQATVIEKLESEGAICVAKANLDAFAHGASTENSDFFTTKNPHDKTRVPGGSSGGSAAAVILDMVPFALGTDTGGSTRQPASFVGCVGYKPTYGLMSRSGIVAMASSTDTVGTLAKSVEDAALVIDVMAGKDHLDATTIDREPDGYDISCQLDQGLRGKKFAVIKEYMGEGLASEVREVIDGVVKKLESAGAQVSEISLPSSPLSLAVYYIICPAEVSSNLSRYDGQRYGYSDESAKDLQESYDLSRGHGFGKENKRRIMIGTYVLSSGYYDAYYKKAQTVRTKLINEFNSAFESYDFLVGPVAPTTAFKIGANAADPLSMYLSDVMTVAANLVGIPAISIPAGKAGDLPVGVQLMARQRADRDLLGVSRSLEGILK